MNKLDRLYKKALQGMKIMKSVEWHRNVSAKAVPTYFAIMSYCYNQGLDNPDLGSEEGRCFARELLESQYFKEMYHKSEAGFDVLMKWWEHPPQEDTRTFSSDGGD